MTEPWHRFCLREIDSASKYGRKRMSAWESELIGSVRPRIERGISLSQKQEDVLVKIHQRMTDIVRSR